jgi:hypothetical protein
VSNTHKADKEAKEIAAFVKDEAVAVQDFVQTRPLMALAMAMLFGVVVGRFVI